MRASALLLLPLLLGLVPGCGDGGGSALRVDVESFSFDGDLPAGLRIRRLEAGGRRDEVYDLEPVPGGRAGEYQARDAPDGVYLLEGPAGWWMLQEGGAAASLERGLQPPVLGLGRGRSLYVGPRVAEARPSDVWGAVRVLADGTEEPVPVTVEADERGYVVALRFAPEDWRGALQAVGRVATGPPPTPSPGPEAPLAEAFGFEARADGGPVVTRVRTTPSEPLEVVLVPASDDSETDGLRVRASLEGLPIPSEVEAYAHGGRARFPDVPVVDRLLRLQVGDEPGTHRVDPVLRRRQANLRLLAAGGVPMRSVRVPLAGTGESALDVDLVLVRPAGGVAFGRVPFEIDGAELVFSAPAGEHEVLLRSGERWASGTLSGADDLAAAFLRGVVVGGSVEGTKPGRVVRFFRQVGAGGEAVLGDGFEVRVEPGGAFEAHLPTGRYLVEVAARNGTWRRPATLVATSPGVRMHLPLESP